MAKSSVSFCRGTRSSFSMDLGFTPTPQKHNLKITFLFLNFSVFSQFLFIYLPQSKFIYDMFPDHVYFKLIFVAHEFICTIDLENKN